MQKFALVLAALGISLLPDGAFAEDKCTIHLFYDAFCPFAADFIAKKVYPFMQTELGKYAIFDPNPWGSARKNSDGSYRCRGGNKCKHEITHACVLNKENATIAIKFISCSLKARRKADGDEGCAKKLGINFDELSKCATGEDGKKFYDAFGAKTKALDPGLSYVPLVYFDDKSGKDDRAAGNADIKGKVCEKVPEDVRKAHC